MKNSINETIFGYKYYVFPFDRINKDEEIILYGYGRAGQQYYWQIKSTGYCKIRYVVDKNYKDINIENIDVIPIEQLKDCHNKIVVSVQSGRGSIIDMLKRCGYSEDSIIVSDVSVILPMNTGSVYTKAEEISVSKEGYIADHGRDALEYLAKLKECLKVYVISEYDKNCVFGFVRVGKEDDGGYIMLDAFSPVEEKVAYSFGIADDVSWDLGMAEKGYEVYMYDHTIDSLPCERNDFHFLKKGISDTVDSCGDLETLRNLLENNGHLKNDKMILKMDVEGAEYGFLNNTDTGLLRRFDQIVIELHDLLETNGRAERLKALNKLLETHIPVHIHANNLGSVMYIDDHVFADCVELTLVNRENYPGFKIASEEELYLKDLDRPCWRERKEIFLNNWNGELT